MPNGTLFQGIKSWFQGHPMSHTTDSERMLRKKKKRQILIKTKQLRSNAGGFLTEHMDTWHTWLSGEHLWQGHLLVWGPCGHSPGCAHKQLQTVSDGRRLESPLPTGDPGRWCSRTALLPDSTSTARSQSYSWQNRFPEWKVKTTLKSVLAQL